MRLPTINLFKVYKNYNLLREFEPAKIFLFQGSCKSTMICILGEVTKHSLVEVMYNYEHNLLLELLGDGIHF